MRTSAPPSRGRGRRSRSRARSSARRGARAVGRGCDLVRAAGEVARFVSTHLALAELDASRTRTVQAQLNFLRAQISPHFVYNALTAIESYVRSDPDRASDLLLGFAEFTRSSSASTAST